jgi:hypothetical protein
MTLFRKSGTECDGQRVDRRDGRSVEIESLDNGWRRVGYSRNS